MHGADQCDYADEGACLAQCLREGHAPEQGADLWDGAKSLELTEVLCASATNSGQRVGVPVRLFDNQAPTGYSISSKLDARHLWQVSGKGRAVSSVGRASDF